MDKRVATIKILDEINVAIIGLKISEYEHFYNKYGFYEKSYRFKPSYKLGKWDGKCRLFSKAGKTSIHFLPEIIKDLKSFKYSIKLIDNRVPVDFDVPEVDENTFSDYGVVLGEHQVEAINALLENRGGITVAGTGAGKSYVLGALFNILQTHMKMRCLAIVPSTDLVLQTAAEIELFGNDTGLYYSKAKQLNKTHLVSTWQALQNNPEVVAQFQGVIIDECHGAQSTVLKGLLENHAKRAIFIAGVTGTLPKEPAERNKVHYVLGQEVSKIEGRDLIDKGWLASLKMRMIRLKEDLSEVWEQWRQANPQESSGVSYKQFKANYFPDFTAERAWLKSKKERTEFIAHVIQSATSKTGNSFVLVNGVDYGKRLAKLIPNAIFVYGQDESDVRKQVYDLFSTKDDVIVIATFNLASTGLNIKRIFNLFMIDPGKSFIQIIQSIGRGLRKAHDKNSVTVWDISSDFKYSKSHCTTRKKYYKEQRYNFTEEVIDYINDFINEDNCELDDVNEFMVY